jgi:hypothetical protein
MTILTSSDVANGISSVNLSKCMSQALFPPKNVQQDASSQGDREGDGDLERNSPTDKPQPPKAYLSAINLAMLDQMNDIDDMKRHTARRCRRFGKHYSKVHTKVEQALKKNGGC